MKKDKTQQKFLNYLEDVPITKLACNKAGISRNTIYRWRIKDKNFAKKMDKSLEKGEENVDDLTTAQFIELIKNKHWPAIKYRLQRKPSPHNKSIVEIIDEKTEEKRKILEEWQNALK